MRRRYQLVRPSSEQKLYFEYLLLAEMVNQRWYAIVSLDLWKTQGLICIH